MAEHEVAHVPPVPLAGVAAPAIPVATTAAIPATEDVEEEFDFSGLCGASYALILDGGAAYRSKYEAALAKIRTKYANVKPEFEDDDMNDNLDADDAKHGWMYPLTKTQQLNEFGCVIAEQERFLRHLHDGNISVLEEYLMDPQKSKAVNLNLFDSNGWTSLHYAAYKNDPEMATLLLEFGADSTIRDPVYGRTALDVAKAGGGDFCGPNDEVLEVLQEALM